MQSSETMSARQDASPAAMVAKWLIFVIGLAMALGGLGNSTPAFGPLPRIGPFDVEAYRALLMSGGVVVCLLSMPAETWLEVKSPTLRWTLRLFDVVVGIVALYAFWRFYVVVTELDEGIFFFEPQQAWTTLAGCAAIILMCWRIWGLPLALVGIVMLIYFFTGPIWPGIFKTAPVDFIEDTAGNLWFNNNDGVLGSILGIVTSTIFPFILLGAMLEASGGGRSLIKIAFAAMRGFRGGPAHAAILASGLFGTISGSAVANVVGTGVITIPMIKRRGFAPEFAGGVEATASTGGQVMPPIMGAAALVMADFTGISYLTIIICAIIPALAYYGSLFVVVVYESRRLGVEASDEGETVEVTTTDYINLILVVVPIVIVVAALIFGASPAGSAILALFSLIPLSFLNPDIRRRPFTLVEALATGGVNMGRLMMAAGVVGITVGVLGTTGLPNDFALAISGAAEQYLVVTLVMAAAAALVLGMGMPTLPAYLTIVLILGPSMLAMGLTPLTSHMFVFYFGVASVITPPVAIAAYAAAAIAGGGAIATSVAALRIGIVIFAIPFAFALNPEMLIVSQAAADGEAASLIGVVLIVLRLCLMILLFASSTSRFDATRISLPEAVARFAAGILLIAPQPQVYLTGAVLGLALLAWNRVRASRTAEARSLMSERPNFLYFMTDQHRADWLGCTGHPVVRTPHIDAIAAQGTVFDRFYVAMPVCMPNRASFMTGRYPSVHGLRYNGCLLSHRANTFVDVLKAGGYRTASIGKSHLQPFTDEEPLVRDAFETGPIEEAWKEEEGDFTKEEPVHYDAEGRFHFPTPYYGYDHVDVVTGHGDRAGGHYRQWFRSRADRWQELTDPAGELAHNYTCPHAFRTPVPEALYTTSYIGDRAKDYLAERAGDNAPFFAFVSFPDPHHPFNPPGRYWDMYNPDDFDLPIRADDHRNPPPPLLDAIDAHRSGVVHKVKQLSFLADDQHVREAMALTAGMISMIDDAVGSVIETLKETGQFDNTVIVFNSDHGDYLGDFNLLLKGPWAKESINRVPMIWSDPAARQGTRSNALCSTIDIAPSVLERAGLRPYFGMQGKSFLPTLAGADRHRDTLLIEHNDSGKRMGFDPPARVRTLVSGSWKLSLYKNCDWGELYNLADDPKELDNLWANPQYAAVRDDLTLALAHHLAGQMDESPRSKRLA